MNLLHRISQIRIALRQLLKGFLYSENRDLLLGRLLSENIKFKKNITSLEDVEFKVFSQFGDDGIIQWLVNNMDFKNKFFIEFGVEDYRESNTRFLMINNNWSGLIMDGSTKNITKVINSEYFWKYDLRAISSFITRDNINDILSLNRGDECGLLHIDIDGNDYWIWETIDINPELVIMEYNSVFGSERAITVPYNEGFNRTKSHYSNLYFGASLKALIYLSRKKGYSFIGCNTAGNNAYFVRNDRLNDAFGVSLLESGYVESKLRESRNKKGDLSYLSGLDRYALIKGMPVFNVETNEIEKL